MISRLFLIIAIDTTIIVFKKLNLIDQWLSFIRVASIYCKGFCSTWGNKA